MKYFCRKIQFWWACISHICNFVISSFTKTNNFVETFMGYPQFYTLSPDLNEIQKGEYTPNT